MHYATKTALRCCKALQKRSDMINMRAAMYFCWFVFYRSVILWILREAHINFNIFRVLAQSRIDSGFDKDSSRNSKRNSSRIRQVIRKEIRQRHFRGQWPFCPQCIFTFDVHWAQHYYYVSLAQYYSINIVSLY